jgi:hypothetical protein
VYDNLKPICNALDCAAPEELNNQAKQLFKALTGREEDFNIGGGSSIRVGTLYANGTHANAITQGSTTRCISNAASITSINQPTIAKLLHGMEYFNFDLNAAGGQVDAGVAIAGLWFLTLLPWCPAGTIDMTTTDDQYPTKWLSIFIDLDNLCARLFWIKLDLNDIPSFTTNKEFIEYLNSCRGDEYVLGDMLDYVSYSSNRRGMAYMLGSSAGGVPSGATGTYYAGTLIELSISINSKTLGKTSGTVYVPLIALNGDAQTGPAQWHYWDIEDRNTFAIDGSSNYPSYADGSHRHYIIGWRLETSQ